MLASEGHPKEARSDGGGFPLTRSAQHEGQGVQAGAEFLSQSLMYRPRAGNAVFAREGGGNHGHGIMRLTTGTSAGMTGVERAVILHIQLSWRESLVQPGGDSFVAGHVSGSLACGC